MKKLVLALALSLLSGAMGLCYFNSQQAEPSLGELARREREHKKGLSQGRPQVEGIKFSPEERAAFNQVVRIVSEESRCKKLTGNYAGWEQLLAGCGSAEGKATAGGPDPRADANYDFRLIITQDKLEIAAVPKRRGPAGFFANPEAAFYNPRGPASTADQKLCEFDDSGSVHANAALEASGAKVKPKVWTEEDLATLHGNVSVIGGESGTASTTPEEKTNGQGLEDTKRAAELTVIGVAVRELDCRKALGRYLDWGGLVDGCETPIGRLNHADPRGRIPEYDFILKVGADSFEVSAVPKRSDLPGFYSDGKHLYGSEKGPASSRDIEIMGINPTW